MNFLRKTKEKFPKPHTWDLGKQFRRICKTVGITDLGIHDLRHFATTMLFMEGVADANIPKMTGHRSKGLAYYKHFSPAFLQQTIGLIDGKLPSEITRRLVQIWLYPQKKKKATQ